MTWNVKRVLEVILVCALVVLAVVCIFVNVSFAANDTVDTKCGADAETLEGILPDPLSGYAQLILDMEEEHGVNAVFMCAIAQQETGSGNAGVGRTHKHNLFGMSGKRFESYEDSIEHAFALMASDLYIGSGRDTIESIGKRYNPETTDSWIRAVRSIMQDYNDQIKEVNDASGYGGKHEKSTCKEIRYYGGIQ